MKITRTHSKTNFHSKILIWSLYFYKPQLGPYFQEMISIIPFLLNWVNKGTMSRHDFISLQYYDDSISFLPQLLIIVHSL